MKISFGNSVDKVNKPPLKVNGGYVKTDKLTDEQVKQINGKTYLKEEGVEIKNNNNNYVYFWLGTSLAFILLLINKLARK